MEAPTWLDEPPSKLWFVSSSGGSVTCRARGSPRPSVKWVNHDGSPVTTIPGLREVSVLGCGVWLGKIDWVQVVRVWVCMFVVNWRKCWGSFGDEGVVYIKSCECVVT